MEQELSKTTGFKWAARRMMLRIKSGAKSHFENTKKWVVDNKKDVAVAGLFTVANIASLATLSPWASIPLLLGSSVGLNHYYKLFYLDHFNFYRIKKSVFITAFASSVFLTASLISYDLVNPSPCIKNPTAFSSEYIQDQNMGCRRNICPECLGKRLYLENNK